MQESNTVDYHNVLPGELMPHDITKARLFLENLSLPDLHEWTRQRTQTYTVHNDCRFRVVVDRPLNGDDDQAVLVLSGFEENNPQLIVKSRVIRDMVNPAATLIIQPSSTDNEPNMNYSPFEQNLLTQGNLEPIIGRVAIVMASVGNPMDVTLFGASQGAMVGLGYAAHSKTPSAAVSVIEIPNIIERQRAQILSDFEISSRDSLQVIKANFENHESPFAAFAECVVSSKPSIARYVLSSMCPDNQVMVDAMCHATAQNAIESIINKGGSVVHAWGDQDNVSPNTPNQYIAAMFEARKKYTHRVLHGTGYAASELYALDGALARLAHNSKIK
jgi:pimeloyl-ACP methyl ester carboxylesterase